MKRFLFIAFTLHAAAAFACSDPLYRLSLNQRTFYNPAALCPYCKGSTFFASGMNFLPRSEAFGYFFTLGNDGENRLHGPWDISWAHSYNDRISFSSYSLRYAWRQNVGDWRLAGGFRASLLDIERRQAGGEGDIIPAAPGIPFHTQLPDLDAGVMLTDQNGFYIGLSAQHLGSPQRTISDGSGFSERIGMQRNYVLMSGAVIRISEHFDLLPDLNSMYDGTEAAIQPGCLLRYAHHATIGGGVLITQSEQPQYELRGGYTGSVFKWLGAVAFTPEGPVIETGIVLRFGATRWRLYPIDDPCTGGACTPPPAPPKKREFDPHQ